MNDLPERVEINSSKDHHIFQNDLKELERWALDWGMGFNPDKFISFQSTEKAVVKAI